MRMGTLGFGVEQWERFWERWERDWERLGEGEIGRKVGEGFF